MCSDCSWEKWHEKINRLLKTKRWAFDTLDGIRKNVEFHGHITPRQEQAVTNIAKRK